MSEVRSAETMDDFDLEDCLNAMLMTALQSANGNKDAETWTCKAGVAGYLAAEIKRLQEYEWMYKDLCK